MKDYEAITLSIGACKLELVPEFGGLSNKLKLGAPGKESVEVIAGLTNRHGMETDGEFRNIPLFPIVNRLDKGQYNYDGKNYRLNVNEPTQNNTLHGFLQHIKPTVTFIEDSTGADDSHNLQQTAACCLHYDYDGSNAGYPFPVEVNITYTLNTEGSLHIQFEVINKHNNSIPLGIGWHPYFQLGESVDGLHLQLPPVIHTEVNSRMLPTGLKTDFVAFETLSTIGKKQLDHCFELKNPECASKTTLWSDSSQYGLELWQQSGADGFNFIQICIPPDRKSIAIEPVSCGINAFNTQEGIIEIAEKGSLRAECGVRICYSSDSHKTSNFRDKT